MRFDFRNPEERANGKRYYITNLDTGERMTPLLMADDATGDFIRYVQPWKVGPDGRVMTESGNARIQVIEFESYEELPDTPLIVEHSS